MKKLALLLCAVAGFAAFGGTTAKADRGYDDSYDYAPRQSYREHREYREHRDDCRRVYIIENERPVRRIVYFDRFNRCYYPAGARRVYVETYYTEYPRHYRPYRRAYYDGDYYGYARPHVSASFSFGGRF